MVVVFFFFEARLFKAVIACRLGATLGEPGVPPQPCRALLPKPVPASKLAWGHRSDCPKVMGGLRSCSQQKTAPTPILFLAFPVATAKRAWRWFCHLQVF